MDLDLKKSLDMSSGEMDPYTMKVIKKKKKKKIKNKNKIKKIKI